MATDSYRDFIGFQVDIQLLERFATGLRFNLLTAARSDPIGVVTKNSRVRIVKTQNNWYQVDVIEQGRDRGTPLTTNRGWLNKKYVDLD